MKKTIFLLFSKNVLLKKYEISLGATPEGDKQYEGDNKTPEGLYRINDKNPNSRFYRNLGVSYPNELDIEEAASLQKTVGGDIKIHGLGNIRGLLGKWHLQMDWTAGYIAVTDEEMEELYDATPVGVPILILK